MSASKWKNITPQILEKVGRNLHLDRSSPLCIIKQRIESYFADNYKDKYNNPLFSNFDQIEPVVSTRACFDELLIPKDHPGRALTDTFYFDKDTVLRTHTSAHQTELIRAGNFNFLATGDCYRRDEIDNQHYPIFHQTEGVRIWQKDEVTPEFVLSDLKSALEGMVKDIFGNVKIRWNDDYFPFTEPSLEMEVFFGNEWMEILGCGIIHPKVLHNSKLNNHHGWAFGLGLERLAMILFGVPDIRLFWSSDDRFTSQFISGEIKRFMPFSKYPPVYKDISFWHDSSFHENDFSEIIRDNAGDIVENVDVIDQFTHPKTQRKSSCYRITYRSLERVCIEKEHSQSWPLKICQHPNLGK